MRGFLTGRMALAAAWFVVVAGLAAGLTLAFLQPRPPASGNAVTMVVILDEPAAESTAAEPVPAPEGTAEAAGPELPSAALERPAAESASDSAAAAPAPEEPAPEDPSASLALPAADAAAPAEEEVSAVVALPPAEAPATDAAAAPAAEPATGPDAPPEDGGGASPAAAAPENPPDPPGETEANAAAETPAAAPAPAAEQQAAIPAIPPALEQLPTWERYRQPFNMDDKRPRIAVVLTGLGLSDSATEAAINQLPPAVTLSFSPYARGLERWIALARARGHEVMLDLPMEPATFPNDDPGPQGLLVGLSPEENLNRLDWVLSRGSAYVGLAGAMGSRFTASRKAVEPVLREVKDRGLMFLDRRTTESSLVPEVAGEIGLPAAINNRSVDERQASRVAIDARLAQIERIALTEGFAVAMAQPYPVTLDRLAEWCTEIIARGFALAPISALAGQQEAR